MRIAIIANPVAGRGRSYKKLSRYLKNWPHQEWEFEVLPTLGSEHAGEIARQLLSSPPDLLAVCGGDGTMEEVVTCIPETPFPVALLPAGTANVLARELGLPLDPLLALQVALKRVIRRVDLGILHGRTVRRFLLMAGVGFDAYVAAKVRPAWKRRTGIAAYYFSTITSLMTYPFIDFQVNVGCETVSANSCIIANAKGYGGGLVLVPQADMTDGFLDILSIGSRSRLDSMRFLFSSWLGRPRYYPFVRYLRGPSVRVEGPRGLWVQIDGEPIGTLPVEISLNPAAFPLVVPG